MELRSYRKGDARRVLEFFRRVHRQDATVPAISARAWSNFVARPHHHGGRDFRLALAGGRVVALATSSFREQERPAVRHFRIFVAPSHRRQGLALELLTQIAAQGPRSALLQSLCPREWKAGLAFLETAGFKRVESELEMEARRLRRPPIPLPAGIALFPADHPRRHAGTLAPLHNLGFRGTTSPSALRPADLAALMTTRAVLWLAMRRDRVVGFCHAERQKEGVYVENVVVHPAWRGRGIGSHLIFRSAPGRARLSVTSANPAALSVYEQLGFRIRRASHRYRAPAATLRSPEKR